MVGISPRLSRNKSLTKQINTTKYTCTSTSNSPLRIQSSCVNGSNGTKGVVAANKMRSLLINLPSIVVTSVSSKCQIARLVSWART